MKHLFIINPVAGKKPDVSGLSAEIEKLMSKIPEPWEIYITKAPMDACYKIRSEAEKEKEQLRVYACGGDGTLNEAVNGAAGFPHVSITHYPTGTGNDFIRMFGAEDCARFRSLEALIHGRELPLDLIECNKRYSINICSVGIDARIGGDVHKFSHLPFVSGIWGYILSLISNLIKGVNQELKLKYGDSEKNGSFALICACNGRYYGGGFNPVPDAQPDDGIIDFLIAKNVSRIHFIKMVGKYAKGKYRQMTDILTYYGGSEMYIESCEPMVINIDGEIEISNKLHLKIHPGAINFIFPKESAFFISRARYSE